jgi:ATP-dependent Lon protease
MDLSAQVQKLEEKIKGSNLPPDLTERLNLMVSLIKADSASSSSFVNFEKASTYISWVCSIPFDKLTQDNLDLTKARDTLDKNHYGLPQIKESILDYLGSLVLSLQKNGQGSIRAPIICLVGLVGTGKTSLAYSIAEALGRKFERIPFGGMGEASTLRGQSRTFPEAEPGAIIKKLVAAASRNPVVLLDELDRVTEGGRTDIMGTLVELLDPEQNHSFTDHYIDFPVDLSNVLFVATANNTTNISPAVLDRFQILQMPAYSDEEKTVIGKNYLLPKISEESGLDKDQLKIDDALWPDIIRPLGFDSGIRSLERSIEAIAKKVARLIVEKKADLQAPFYITPQNIKEFLPK